MEGRVVIREKALRLAVRTGEAPDLDFVWNAQEAEGTLQCFGSFQVECSIQCRWYEKCRIVSAESIDTPWPPGAPARHSIESDTAGSSAGPTASSHPVRERWVPSTAREGVGTFRRTPPL